MKSQRGTAELTILVQNEAESSNCFSRNSCSRRTAVQQLTIVFIWSNQNKQSGVPIRFATDFQYNAVIVCQYGFTGLLLSRHKMLIVSFELYFLLLLIKKKHLTPLS